MIEIYDDFVPDTLLKKLSWDLTYIVPYHLSTSRGRGNGRERWALGTARERKLFNATESKNNPPIVAVQQFCRCLAYQTITQ